MSESSLKSHLASPVRFRSITRVMEPLLLIAALVLMGYGIYLVFWVAPEDYQQGETVRIMYIHVPAAWLSLGLYSGLAVSSFVFLVWKHGIADLAARAMAPIGAVFAFITLVTGAIWGKPMWGTWWVWDARLTSMLILLFIYLGYMALGAAFEQSAKGRKLAAIYALLGAINLPIIRFSVEWWNTLHQPASVIRAGGPTIHGDLLQPLLIMALGLSLWVAVLVIKRIHSLQMEQKIRRLELKQPR